MMKTVMRMEAELKNSGVPWLGKIPCEWKVGKVKRTFCATKTIVGNRADEFERLALTLKGVIKKSKEAAGGLQPEQFNSYQILKQNELVFKLIDLGNVATSRIGLSLYTGIVSPAYIVLHKRDNAIPCYGKYYFIYMWMGEIFNHMGDDGVRSSLSAKDLLNIPYLEIPTFEQQAIANYLDTTCAQIDTLIAGAKTSIEEYKKLKQAVIYEAVTKGLDKNAEMKDSDVYWIGNIPLAWDVIKVKYVVQIENGTNPSTEGNIPVYGSGSNSFKTCGEYKIGPTVLLGRKGATLHIPHYIEGKYWNVDTAFNTIPISNRVDLKYFYYVSSCFDYKRYISQTTLPGMTQTSYRNIYMPYPSLAVQGEIAKWLDDKIENINSLISEKEALIQDLEAYKKSLIYEVVTGKRRVGGSLVASGSSYSGNPLSLKGGQGG